MTIGIVEDNDNIREALRRYLELEGWQVREYSRLAPLERLLADDSSPLGLDLLVLDVMLPDGDGFLFARKLRKKYALPLMFVTARNEESDRITGLELGADDYLVKPFSNRELVLRIKALLRRSATNTKQEQNKQDSKTWQQGDETLSIDPTDHTIQLNQTRLSLTAAEWHILRHLSNEAPRVCTRPQLLQACLDSIAEGSERTIDTHIKNLRHKLGKAEWIETVRAFGYRFNGQSPP